MEQKKMEALIQSAVGDVDLAPCEIPSIDLYLDQIISLVTDKRSHGSEHFSDRVLTKTMINNYSKDGLISPIKGKKYTKEQILQMLLVYEMKNTLSIGEIKRILQNVYRLPAYNEEKLTEVFDRYLEIKEYERREVGNIIDAFIGGCGLDITDEMDLFTCLLGLSSLSSYLKDVVQVLLENRYPDLNLERAQKEQEKREEAKRQKEEKKNAAKAKKEAATSAPDAETEETK